MIAGWTAALHRSGTLKNLAIVMLALSVLVRSGVAPLHCWMTDLFENASLGTAILFVAPMSGAYAAVRLVLPLLRIGLYKALPCYRSQPPSTPLAWPRTA